eukprot:2186668-Rhodomonas_salina.2
MRSACNVGCYPSSSSCSSGRMYLIANVSHTACKKRRTTGETLPELESAHVIRQLVEPHARSVSDIA